MLKGIPKSISPELLKVLDEMGHADVLVIGDSNFPATSLSKCNNHINIRLDGNDAVSILDDVLSLFPIDNFVNKPIAIMQKTEMHKDYDCQIHKDFENVIKKYDERGKDCIEYVERFDFYERSKNAYAIISTTENRPYGCILIQKGCV